MSSSPFGKTSVAPKKRPGAELGSKKTLRSRLGEKAQYKGLSDEEVEARIKGVKKKKKKVRTPEAIALSEARKAKRDKKQRILEKRQAEIERERIKAESIAVVDVSQKDSADFTDALDVVTKDVRNFMLKKLASQQFGVLAGLDTALQELNILLEGGVSATAKDQFIRLSADIAMVALADKLCSIYGVDKVTRRRIINARVAYLEPKDKPAPTSLRELLGAGPATAAGRRKSS